MGLNRGQRAYAKVLRTAAVAVAVTSSMIVLQDPTHAVETTSSPFRRIYPSIATNPVTGHVVLFGGQHTQALGDTWIWNGSAWKPVNAPIRPSARYGAAMAADRDNGTIVLFGGCCSASGGALGDTWIWDGATKAWRQETPAVSPPPAQHAAMAYDSNTRTVVLFDGGPRLGTVSDLPAGTWTWDGANWTRRTPASSPPSRVAPAMASDPSTGGVVLFGGEKCHGCAVMNDTWTWDGLAGTWRERTPVTSPKARVFAYMADHAGMNRVVLFGGTGDTDDFLSDTWTWDGASKVWTKMRPQTKPCARARGAMAYHLPTGNAVIFGGNGYSCSVTAPDTWTWNGVNWKRRI